MKRVILLLLVAFFCSGCFTTTSNVLPFGPDTFTVIAENDVDDSVAAKNNAIMKANQHCKDLGKQFLPVTATSSIGKYDLTFRCLNANDPELQRPVWESAPDVVIENK